MALEIVDFSKAAPDGLTWERNSRIGNKPSSNLGQPSSMDDPRRGVSFSGNETARMVEADRRESYLARSVARAPLLAKLASAGRARCFLSWLPRWAIGFTRESRLGWARRADDVGRMSGEAVDANTVLCELAGDG